MSTQPTPLQQVAQRNGNGPRVPRLPADRQAIADEAAARILRLSRPDATATPRRSRSTATASRSPAPRVCAPSRPASTAPPARPTPTGSAWRCTGARWRDAPRVEAGRRGDGARRRTDASDRAMDGWSRIWPLDDTIFARYQNARPLVVIDPEDREQVERLTKALVEAAYRHSNVVVSDQASTATRQAALREFADPKPPKPAEPTGLGAVVEDARASLAPHSVWGCGSARQRLQRRLLGRPTGCRPRPQRRGPVMTDDLATARAFLDHENWWDSLTDDQRAELSRRRSILGSLDDTHALNRSERGSASVLAIGIALVLTGIWLASRTQPIGAYLLLVFGAWSLGLWLMVRGARHGAAIRERLDAEARRLRR
jgi:hypothetical protein